MELVVMWPHHSVNNCTTIDSIKSLRCKLTLELYNGFKASHNIYSDLGFHQELL